MPPPSSPSRGNALFLILIAVALFAALSYAVTQSGRGGASADKERAVLMAAKIVQYASQVRTAVQRMTLTGTAIADLKFCTTGVTDCNITAGNLCTTGTDCVFAPEGGGVPVIDLPDGASTGANTWRFVEDGATFAFNMEGVGTNTAEIAMYTTGSLTLAVCEEINRGLGLSLPVAADANGLVFGSPWEGYAGSAAKCTFNLGFSYQFVQALVER